MSYPGKASPLPSPGTPHHKRPEPRNTNSTHPSSSPSSSATAHNAPPSPLPASHRPHTSRTPPKSRERVRSVTHRVPRQPSACAAAGGWVEELHQQAAVGRAGFSGSAPRQGRVSVAAPPLPRSDYTLAGISSVLSGPALFLSVSSRAPPGVVHTHSLPSPSVTRKTYAWEHRPTDSGAGQDTPCRCEAPTVPSPECEAVVNGCRVMPQAGVEWYMQLPSSGDSS